MYRHLCLNAMSGFPENSNSSTKIMVMHSDSLFLSCESTIAFSSFCSSSQAPSPSFPVSCSSTPPNHYAVSKIVCERICVPLYLKNLSIRHLYFWFMFFCTVCQISYRLCGQCFCQRHCRHPPHGHNPIFAMNRDYAIVTVWEKYYNMTLSDTNRWWILVLLSWRQNRRFH